MKKIISFLTIWLLLMISKEQDINDANAVEYKDLSFSTVMKSRKYINHTEEPFPDPSRSLPMKSFLAKSFRQRAFLKNQKYGIRFGFPRNRWEFEDDGR